ncbi:MAG: ATP-binding protein [Endomicrobium sp.]|uniref:ATP-binding protein n=1 Tax=Candidatus Endomicrobiellum cubanum TaxID=3242325 RepID=UPI00282FB23D|nr:ATP-binding protein [Endomicrobium sp.]
MIKVIIGIRRSGKSTLLDLFRDELKLQGVKDKQIQSYNFEDPELNYDLDWRKIYEKIIAKIVADDQNYIFLDEVQTIPKFEKLVDGLFIKKNIDVYITGSNAFLLSGELATLLTGRYITIHILPFSFAEYRQSFLDEQNEDRLFAEYLNASSFPEAVTLSQRDKNLSMKYISDVYDTILKRDIYTRYQIRNKVNFERVLKFICNNIGSPVSANAIAAELNRGKKTDEAKITHNVIVRWLSYLAECYLIYPVSRYNIKGKKLLTTNDKYYIVDLSLRSLLLGRKSDEDLGHRLENIVYLELLRRYNVGQIYVGKKDDKEVDFIVQLPNTERLYIQVAYSVKDSKTLTRELESLRKIRDNNPKMLLTTDLGSNIYYGIKQINVVDWLLETK